MNMCLPHAPFISRFSRHSALFSATIMVLLFIPDGVLMLRHTNCPTSLSLCYRCQPHDCVCREKPIIEKPPEASLKKESENTLVLLLSNNKCSQHHPLLHVVTDLFSSTVCLHSLQTVVKDNMMNKTSAHKENLGFYSTVSSHIFYFMQS